LVRTDDWLVGKFRGNRKQKKVSHVSAGLVSGFKSSTVKQGLRKQTIR